MLELTTQSRKRKIKDDNNFFEFYKPYKKRKTDKDDEDISFLTWFINWCIKRRVTLQIYVLIAKVSFLVFVYKILLTSLSIKDFFNMIKNFVVGCFFKASLSRLAANRLSSSAKTLAKSSVSSGVQLRQRTFALLILFTSFFFVWFLAYFIKISLLYVVPVFKLKITYCVWLQKPRLCKENDYTNILYFLCEH